VAKNIFQDGNFSSNYFLHLFLYKIIISLKQNFMIALTHPVDQIQAQITTTLVAGNTIPCYCSWENIGGPAVDSKITALNSGLPQTIAIMTGTTASEIREITISNVLVAPLPPVANGFPINVIIYYWDGAHNLYYQLFNCILQAGETLSYNATPGINGSWQILSTRGAIIS
jgi:hypothetical protein